MHEMTDDQLEEKLRRALDAEVSSIEVDDAADRVARARVRAARGSGARSRVVAGVAAALIVAVVAGAGFAAWRDRTEGAVPGASASETQSALASAEPSRTPAVTTPSSQLAGRFIPTGAMIDADDGLAILLLDGRVLITGSAATSPELYDPRTGMFTRTGAMTTDRGGATATLLQDGRVLIAGGITATATLASAELYDPTMGKFSTTGSMNAARERQTATLLSDGRVLIAGGLPPSTLAMTLAYHPRSVARGTVPVTAVGPSNLSSAELYDPKTGEFSITGSMTVGRGGQTSTILSDGRVLVAGGTGESEGGDGPALSSAELYDPGTGTFSATGTMTSGREYDTATLLPNGRVLIAGGVDESGRNVTSAELYDPVAGRFRETGPLTQARQSHAATLLSNGQVLITGGRQFVYEDKPGGWGLLSWSTLASAESYDPQTGVFSPIGSMTTARFGHVATLLPDGRVLLAGGAATSSASTKPTAEGLASAELYQP
jgi:large repetitive protein